MLLTATGHSLMSGRPISGWPLSVAFALTLPAAWCLAGRERNLLTVGAAAMTTQGTLHTLFSSWPAPGAPPMHHMHTGASSTALPLAVQPPPETTSSWGMLVAHLLAALLSGLWLAHGERGAFRLLRALPAGLFRPLGLLLAVVPVPVDRPRFRPVRPADERAPRRLHLAHSLVSRGPPPAGAVT
ncbi:hypothetical protein [Streptomyces sp. NPDC093111]|uniref:hypothetical protein n=1 Tax=Streptomyces sp. NPDC093111 TaxID=3154978 RepID=UPI003449FC3D